MTPYFADDHLTVYAGDVRDVLPTLPAESVHCVVTSPPYWGLRDYGVAGQLGLEPTPEEHVANLVGIFREVRRALRPDGTVWLNLGDSYAGSWGALSRGNHTGDDKTTLDGHSGGLTTHGRQISEHPHFGRFTRTRALGGGRKPKDLTGIPWMVAFALRADGWYLRSDIIWAKPNPMPESVTDRPTKAHEYLFLLSRSPRYYYDTEAVREADSGQDHPRSVLSGQPSLEPTNGLMAPHRGLRQTSGRNGSGRNLRSVWTIATQPYPGAHFATFPEKLVEPCILAGCPPEGIVLDPFAGSGTTGRVANRLGRRAVLVELNPEYIDQALTRNAQAPLGLGA